VTPGAEAAASPRSPRQWLSERTSATVDTLLDAGLEALGELGFDDLSLREVARRAGVTHTTAYSYFSSKEHLVAEIHWRLIRQAPPVEADPAAPLPTRLGDALRSLSTPYAGEPELARGILASMLGNDPDTVRVRNAIGEDVTRRIADALGPDTERPIVTASMLLYSGAMLQAGLGHLGFDEVVDHVTAAASLWTD
jgi:AcrR family transcriptional regulator